MRTHAILTAALLTSTAALAFPSATLAAPGDEDASAPASAAAEEPAPTVQKSAKQHRNVPFNIGFVPYVDVNSHFQSPRNHASLNALVGLGGRVDGASVSGLTDILRDDLNGAQLSGLGGYVNGTTRGAQLGGVASVARGSLTGAQLSGVANVAANDVRGVQISGAGNYARSVQGAQIGIVNVAGHAKGAQLGIVNIAREHDGAPIGLLNIVAKDGRHNVDVWTSDTSVFSMGTKLGSKHFYSILGVGLQPMDGKTAWLPTLGLGGRIPVTRMLSIKPEATIAAVNVGNEWDEDSLLAKGRLTAELKFQDQFAIFAGPTLNVLTGTNEDKRLDDVSYIPSISSTESGDRHTDLGIGFVLGVQAF